MLLKLASDVTNVDLFEKIKKVEKYERLITENIINTTFLKKIGMDQEIQYNNFPLQANGVMYIYQIQKER